MTATTRGRIPRLICASCLSSALLISAGATTAVAATLSPADVPVQQIPRDDSGGSDQGTDSGGSATSSDIGGNGTSSDTGDQSGNGADTGNQPSDTNDHQPSDNSGGSTGDQSGNGADTGNQPSDTNDHQPSDNSGGSTGDQSGNGADTGNQPSDTNDHQPSDNSGGSTDNGGGTDTHQEGTKTTRQGTQQQSDTGKQSAETIKGECAGAVSHAIYSLIDLGKVSQSYVQKKVANAVGVNKVLKGVSGKVASGIGAEWGYLDSAGKEQIFPSVYKVCSVAVDVVSVPFGLTTNDS